MSKNKKKKVNNGKVGIISRDNLHYLQHTMHRELPLSPTELADEEIEKSFFLELTKHVAYLPYLPWIECCKDSKQPSDDVLSTRESFLKNIFFTKNKLLMTLYLTQTLAMPEYADKEFYTCQLLFCGKSKTEEDRFYDLTMATRTAFSIECSGLSFWSKVDEAARDNDKSTLMALAAFVTNYSSCELSSHRMKNPAARGNKETAEEDFLFNEGVLWQLHFNPVLLNQWLVAAQNALLNFEINHNFHTFKSSSFPPQIASAVQIILMLFSDLQRRLNYGFALIGHQVKMYPKKDDRVTTLIMEDVVAPCLGYLKAFLFRDNNHELFLLHFFKSLPGVIAQLRAKNDKTEEKKEVFIHNGNIFVDSDNELEESMYTFSYWVNSFKVIKPCFGDIITKIEDLKAKINESKKMVDKSLEGWNGSSYIPEKLLQTLDQAKPQNSIEERVFQLAKQMVHVETKSNPRYPDWTFIYYILPAFVNCFRKDSSPDFKYKLSMFFLEELVDLFSKDHDAWKSRSGPEETTTNLLSGNPRHVTSLLAFRRKFLDRICSVVPKKFRTISTPIMKLNELLSQNAANNVPSTDPAMTKYLHRLALDWTLKGASWTNMIIFALTEGMARFGSLCASAEASPAPSQLKSLLLAVYAMIELVTVYQTESSLAKGCTFRLQTLEEVYLDLLGGSKGRGQTAVTAWQRLGVLLHQLYEMCKTILVPENYAPPNCYPENTKLILKYFVQKDLRKLKLEIASMCIDLDRQNWTWAALEVIKRPSEKLLFAPYLSRLDKEEGKIRSWKEDLLLPLKHCRFCGRVEENLVMCSFCEDDEEYPDVNWFCGERCENLAMKKCQHNEEHDQFIIEKISI
ncbi:uncharacterized protein LOC132200735 isoform X2 [Neocloeon triangulifer]|uniref:uncharacterized protein LOC132200735 isoform X2 n=1 Tax=Neocloeon triangulifer TaxID=2078957 RepID=UPI00286EC75F|nr:uncharacterized protein LOC132200735 isoform X2 [Neocloeon triangulifer]